MWGIIESSWVEYHIIWRASRFSLTLRLRKKRQFVLEIKQSLTPSHSTNNSIIMHFCGCPHSDEQLP